MVQNTSVLVVTPIGVCPQLLTAIIVIMWQSSNIPPWSKKRITY